MHRQTQDCFPIQESWIYIICHLSMMQNKKKMLQKIDEILELKDILHVIVDQKSLSFQGYIMMKNLLTLCNVFEIILNSISTLNLLYNMNQIILLFANSNLLVICIHMLINICKRKVSVFTKLMSHMYNLELDNALHETQMWRYLLLIYHR